MSKTVCMLVAEHPFLDARIFKKEAKSLKKQGYHVTMIVPRRNGYLFDTDGSIFYDQFRKWEFIHEGIHIITYEQLPLEQELRALHYNLQTGNSLRFTDPLTQLGMIQQADIYHAHEFASLYSGVGIKRALATKGKACKLIYDCHELAPDPLIKESRNRYRLKQDMLAIMLKETDHLITVSQSIKSWHSRLHPAIPIDIIYNSPPLSANYNPGKGDRNDLVIVFEGRLDPKRVHFKKLLDIVRLSNKSIDLSVRIIGGSRKSDNSQSLPVPAQIADKVEYCGWLDYDEIPQAMKHADIGWIDLDSKNSLNNCYAMPNKLFSYLNNGLPVLVNQCSDMGELLHKHECGYVVNKQQANAEDYVEALMEFHASRKRMEAMSKNARDIMVSNYSWEHMERRLAEVYQQLES